MIVCKIIKYEGGGDLLRTEDGQMGLDPWPKRIVLEYGSLPYLPMAAKQYGKVSVVLMLVRWI